ncbi:MAG: c-type cytochrome [Bryobacteraceae bacterium]|jgi:mono/diheme cytochrome c family protein
MKSLIASVNLLLSLLLIGLASGTARAQPAPASVKMVPVRPTQSLLGKDVYREYCAVCHGIAGKGDGPAAGAFKVQPSDLTQIARKNGGKYPELRVQHIIKGDADQPIAHGTREMPVWGYLFQHMTANQDPALRVYNLVKYIEGMQAK